MTIPGLPATSAHHEQSSILDSWTIRETDFPRHGGRYEQVAFLLNYAILAPSSHNTQPWLFRICDHAIEIYADRTRALPVIDPEGRELTINCGAALLNLRVAMRHFGHEDVVEIFPDAENRDLLVRIYAGAPFKPDATDEALFAAIPSRHTSRHAFENRLVPSELLTALQGEAYREGAWLHLVEGEATREALADLIVGGETILWENKRFRHELAAWLHPNRSRRRDGIPGYAEGLGDLASLLKPLMDANFDMHREEVASDRNLIGHTPVLAVLGTDDNNPSDWLAAGQALERVLLTARSEGVWASFMNQPIEVAELRPRLREIIGCGGSPQLIIRLGYGPDVKPTPRRPLEEVLLSE